MITSHFKMLLAEKEIRERRTISLREVTRATGVSISLVQGLANNTLRTYPHDGLDIVCSYLECGVGDLLVHRIDAPKREEVSTQKKTASGDHAYASFSQDR